MNNAERQRASYRRYRNKNKDKINAQHRARNATEKGKLQNKLYCQRWVQKSRYGFSIEQKAAMLAEQENRCAICKRHMIKPSTDHEVDNGSPRVRGLLCNDCNRAIGMFNEDIQVLASAIDYLSTRSVSYRPELSGTGHWIVIHSATQDIHACLDQGPK